MDTAGKKFWLCLVAVVVVLLGFRSAKFFIEGIPGSFREDTDSISKPIPNRVNVPVVRPGAASTTSPLVSAPQTVFVPQTAAPPAVKNIAPTPSRAPELNALYDILSAAERFCIDRAIGNDAVLEILDGRKATKEESSAALSCVIKNISDEELSCITGRIGVAKIAQFSFGLYAPVEEDYRLVRGCLNR